MRDIAVLLSLLLPFLAPQVLGFDSTSDFDSADGSAAIDWDENYSGNEGADISAHTEYRRAADGTSSETQTITRQNRDGSTTTETHTWNADGTQSHKSSETAPPPTAPDPPKAGADSSVHTDSQAKGTGVGSDYADGGVSDDWSNPDGSASHTNWTDYGAGENGESGSIQHGPKTSSECDCIPARSVPLICQMSSLAIPGADKSFEMDNAMKKAMPKFKEGASPEELAKSMQQFDPKKMEAAMKKLKEFQAGMAADMKKVAEDPSSVRLLPIKAVKVPWKTDIRLSGYRIEHYKLLSDKKILADLWIAPDIDVEKVLTGGRADAKLLERVRHTLVPSWADQSSRPLFQKLIVRFKERLRDNDYIVKTVKIGPRKKFVRPVAPEGYKRETIKIADALKLANDTMEKIRTGQLSVAPAPAQVVTPASE